MNRKEMKAINRNINKINAAKGVFGCDWVDNIYLELEDIISI